MVGNALGVCWVLLLLCVMALWAQHSNFSEHLEINDHILTMERTRV